jgi:hypothetical protein
MKERTTESLETSDVDEISDMGGFPDDSLCIEEEKTEEDQNAEDEENTTDPALFLPAPTPNPLLPTNSILIQTATQYYPGKRNTNIRRFIETLLKFDLKTACRQMASTAMAGQPVSVFTATYHE